MALIREVKAEKTLMGRLSYGADLLEELTDICADRNIRLGRVEALGAVQKARIEYYDQKKREYAFKEMDEPLEILKLSGNVSVKENAPMIHAHITLADREGNAYGGHLAPGTVVFACEFLIESFEGEELIRSFDEETDLTLWKQ